MGKWPQESTVLYLDLIWTHPILFLASLCTCLSDPCTHLHRNCGHRPQEASHLGPADMTGQLASVQNSVMVPYSMLIWLKKSTAGKETHEVYSRCDTKLMKCRITLLQPTQLLRITVMGPQNSQQKQASFFCIMSHHWWLPRLLDHLGIGIALSIIHPLAATTNWFVWHKAPLSLAYLGLL